MYPPSRSELISPWNIQHDLWPVHFTCSKLGKTHVIELIWSGSISVYYAGLVDVLWVFRSMSWIWLMGFKRDTLSSLAAVLIKFWQHICLLCWSGRCPLSLHPCLESGWWALKGIPCLPWQLCWWALPSSVLICLSGIDRILWTASWPLTSRCSPIALAHL